MSQTYLGIASKVAVVLDYSETLTLDRVFARRKRRVELKLIWCRPEGVVRSRCHLSGRAAHASVGDWKMAIAPLWDFLLHNSVQDMK